MTGLAIGTSGFDYEHWVGAFYPRDLERGRRLEFYARTFSTLELNVTFYRTPKASAFSRWRDIVSDEFRFAVKASRYLTHIRRLRAPREPVEFLMDRVSRLDNRLGPILIQLPPDMRVDLDRLAATLDAFGEGVRVAFEPRHPSWFRDEVCRLLAAHDAVLCLVDRRGPKTPAWRTAGWVYARFHAGRASPPSCYGSTALASWADRLRDGRSRPPEGFAYFNNDGHGCAIRNALQLRRLLDR
ncbi:MAG TPA: DUF72 domain-containing protein [Candidatus Limnocylindrales bacterium]|jgi:uncharacterized protein YecE (DUF72 family)